MTWNKKSPLLIFKYFFSDRHVFNLLLASKLRIQVILQPSHRDRDTLRHIYPQIYKTIILFKEIHICGVNDFTIKETNSVTESLTSGESAVTVTSFLLAKYFKLNTNSSRSSSQFWFGLVNNT